MTFRPASSSSLLLTTALVSVALLALGGFFLALNYQHRDRGPSHHMYLFSGCLMFCMAAGSLYFRIHSYEISSGNLIIKAGFGEKVFPLRDLESVRVEDKPFAGALREMGVGGVWSYYGRFKSPRWGNFRAYATSTSRGVLLTWPDKRVLVTPEDAAQFMQAARPSQ